MDVPEIIVRDRNNLDDYLYEPSTQFQSPEAEKVSYISLIFTNYNLALRPSRLCNYWWWWKSLTMAEKMEKGMIYSFKFSWVLVGSAVSNV